MLGLSASEPPPGALRAGEAVEYFSGAFVWGDRRGYRRAVVTRVGGGANVDTEEVIPTDMMVKRVADRFAILLKPGEAMWRKLRTFELVVGSFAAPTRASALNKALTAAVAAAYAAVREEHRDVFEDIVQETPQKQRVQLSRGGGKLKRCAATQHLDATLYAGTGHCRSISTTHRHVCKRGSQQRMQRFSCNSEFWQCSTSQHPSAPLYTDTGRCGSIGAAQGSGGLIPPADYRYSLAEGGERDDIRSRGCSLHPRHTQPPYPRYQAKKKSVVHVPRSRKRRHLAKCAVTRSSVEIYHAKTVRAVKFQELRNSPEVKECLEKRWITPN